ncbi:thiamine phosphate synthase [Halomonas huangheensis]|uniref:Thiamine-phosphate synthase n=1 Tax=Halomonas huangheensis TaxID=1178482 RepID=W1N7E3_9GAMM|nr:thiamine phosphate synthase [Halomonas huangheensis]ALM54202.1 thiamine-phosphate synthase [Halomonas huangheensis]ERL51116.1 hypothetical protein BJB45_19285 [Halomonas huangheensis]
MSNERHFHPRQLSVYLVTDPGLCESYGLERTVMDAVQGGATLIQLRDKHAPDSELIDIATRLKSVMAESGVPLVINDRVAVAEASGADGVHLGQDDGDVADARRRLGNTAIIGLSVQNVEQLHTLDTTSLDYLGLGPVFATATKSDHAAPLGFEGLARLIAASPLPNVAIGGLKAEHAAQIRQAGADGIAIISAICGQPDPKAATQELVREWERS